MSSTRGLNAISEAEAVKAAQELLRKAMPSEAFIPNGAQEKFMLAVGGGKYRHYALMAGNGIGKTAVNPGNLVPQIIYGKHGWFADIEGLPLFEKWPYPKIGWILGTPSNLKKGGAIYDNLHKFLAPGTYTEDKEGKDYVATYTFPDYDWVLKCWSYEQDPDELEGATVGLIMTDEPMPEGFRGPTMSRLRMGGIFVAGMTPLDGAPWIVDIREEGDLTWFFLGADIEEACKQHGVRGHLEHKHIEETVASYSEYEREARKSGKPLSFSSLVYQEWGNENLTDLTPAEVSWQLVNEEYPPTIWMVLDPHDAKPWVVTWWACYRDGKKVCFMEWPDETQTPYHQTDKVSFGYDFYVQLLKAKEQNLRIFKRVVDARYGLRNIISKQGVTSICGELKKASNGELNFVGSRGAELDNRNLVAQAIHPVKVSDGGGMVALQPMMMADRGCRNFDYAMRHHTHQRNKGVALDSSNRFKEGVTEKNKCFPNTAEYLMGAGAKWVDPRDWLYSDLDTDEIRGVIERDLVGAGSERRWGGYSN